MPHLANRAPPVARACTCSCAREQRAPPALRPVLPGTRRRKRRRGPFGPEVDTCRRIAPLRRRPWRKNPFARGAAQADRHGHLRHISAISAHPQARPAGEICARHEGGPVRARVARGTPIQPRPLTIDPTLACPSSSPASDWYLALPEGPNILRVRTQIFLLQAVGASSISSLRTVMAELGMR